MQNNLVPCDVGIQILVRVLSDDETDIHVAGELLGFKKNEVDSLLSNKYFIRLKFTLLTQNHNLVHLYEGGHKRRVKKYNILARRLILRSPERFSSLTAPYATHKFLMERDSEDMTREPAYYYPIDGPSVEFWNQVYDTQRMLTRFKISAFWKLREKRVQKGEMDWKHVHVVDDTLLPTVFRMNHQYAKNKNFRRGFITEKLINCFWFVIFIVVVVIQLKRKKFPWIPQTNPSEAMSESDSGFSYDSNGAKKLVHHNISKENTSKAMTRWLQPSQFKWMLSGAGWITETQTYYLIGDDGSFCLLQMGYSNLTWPQTNCQVTARYYKAGCTDEYVEGSVTGSESTSGAKAIHRFETQTLSSLRMKLTDDNTSCSLQTSSISMKTNGNSCKISETRSSEKDFSFKMNYSITPATATQPSPFTLDLEYEPLSAPFQLNDGKIYFGATKTDGFIEMKFIPSGRCTGKIQIDGEIFNFNGVGICLRQFQGVRPHLTTKRWNCAYFRENSIKENQPIRTLFTIQMQSSSAYNGETIHYGFYFDGKKLQAVTSKDDSIVYSKTVCDSETGYCVPEHFDYRWKGVDMDNKPFEASVSGTPTSRMARIDLLENLPIVLRKIVESISPARPYIYQNFNQDVEASINGEKVVGSLFQEFSFLLEDPSYCKK